MRDFNIKKMFKKRSILLLLALQNFCITIFLSIKQRLISLLLVGKLMGGEGCSCG